MELDRTDYIKAHEKDQLPSEPFHWCKYPVYHRTTEENGKEDDVILPIKFVTDYHIDLSPHQD